jgi:cyclic beta-1,2-glucan synthetase
MNVSATKHCHAPATSSDAPWHAELASDQAPIRAETHAIGCLETQSRELATAAGIAGRRRSGMPLLARLTANQQVLAAACRRIGVAVRDGEALTPDAEWLLDNFYVIEDVLREVRHDLPHGYYQELPQLRDGPLTGYPRIYSLALVLIAHTDSILDETHITRSVEAYQSVTPLSIGELWAVPTMLRLGLLENLRRLAEQMLKNREEWVRAEAWVAPLRAGASYAGAEPEPVLRLLAPLPRPSDALIVRALQVVRDEGPPAAFEFLKRHLAALEIDVAEVVRRENQRQAVNQVFVGNCVTSLRLLAALDWSAFFERTNPVDPVLRLL